MIAPRASCRARGAPVVRAVLEAALDELSEVGYGALAMEQVALRAGVNKTTVYRRWPTKPDLVAAALAALAEGAPPVEESGDLRADLLAVARRTAAAMSSPRGRAALRVLLGGCPASDLVALATSSRRQFEAPARRLIERAVARGELAADVAPDLLLQVIGGWILNALFRERLELTDARLSRLIDLLLGGARGAHRTPPCANGRPAASQA